MLDMFSAAASISKDLAKMDETSRKSVELLETISKSLSNVERLLIELLRETTNG